MRVFINKMPNSNLFIQIGVYDDERGIIGDSFSEIAPGDSFFEYSYEELLKIVESEDYPGYIDI